LFLVPRSGRPHLPAGVSNVYNNGPKPSAPVGSGGDDDVLGTLGLNPNNPYGQRPTPAPSRPASSGGLYPSLPTDNNPGNRYGGNGGSNGYNGGGGGGGGGAPAGGYGGGSSNGGYGGGGGAGGQFDGAGGGIVLPTRKPTAPASSGGFFGGILSGVQNAVSNAVKQQIGTYINQRLGIGPAAGGAAGGAGGLGGLFDARNLIDNKKLGGLFSENKPAGGGGGGGGPASGQPIAGPGGYPVTVDQRSSATNYYAQPQQSYGQQYGSNTRATERPAYGWN
uniref:Uncharacterized protein n=1 Tax=Anopheles atroparvus TaxID=41427 RepID=A0A182IT28_ANOAO